MALETYNQKRNFKVSPEPQGKASRARKAKGGGGSFVIQKHDATRLHYDFRLEMDGVLKSWAVTRGPSLSPGEKRLAVHVEDHPLDYGGFEGMIPKGNYGAGAVMLWDRGSWEPIGDPHKAYKKGHMEFELKGEKLEGRWHLVRMAKKDGEKRENWLLIKSEDEFARADGDEDILDELPLSVKTGKSLDEIWGRAPARGTTAKKDAAKSAKSKTKPAAKATVDRAKGVKGSKKAKMPDFVEPQLATLVKSAPSGKRWIHEIKIDGYRLQARIETGRNGKSIRLLTRTGLDWTEKFGSDIIAELEKLPADNAIIDGELAVEAGSGATDFSLLQQDLSEGVADRFTFFAFDLLYLDGADMIGAKLTDRKEALQALLAGSGAALRYSEHFGDEGGLVLKHACRLSLEGIISKVAEAPYRSGRKTG
jgi:bifunctional non-homologous end joining protein LigD